MVGIMETKGDMVGMTSTTRSTSRRREASSCSIGEGLAEIDVLYAENVPDRRSRRRYQAILSARHSAEDFTSSPNSRCSTCSGSIIDVLTLGVAALGGISFLMGGVGIFTIMTIAVRERTQEIGLLRALGARRIAHRAALSSARPCSVGRSAAPAASRLGIGDRRCSCMDAAAMPATISPLYVVLAFVHRRD